MKTRILPFLFIPLLLQGSAAACEVCEAQQPKILRGITHGIGPQGNFDYVIVIAAVVLVLFTLVVAVKLLAWPGERGSDHIKRTVLHQDHHGI